MPILQEGDYNFTEAINNELIKGTLMEERGNSGQKKVGNYTMKFQLDNEYNVIFLVEKPYFFLKKSIKIAGNLSNNCEFKLCGKTAQFGR